MSTNLDSNFEILTEEEFNQLTSYDKNTLYIVDNKHIYKGNGSEKKEIFNKVVINYLDENDGCIESKTYMKGEKIEPFLKIISSDNIYKIYTNNIYENNNIFAKENEQYKLDLINIAFNTYCEYDYNIKYNSSIIVYSDNSQEVAIPLNIKSNKKLYMKNTHLNTFCFHSKVTYSEYNDDNNEKNTNHEIEFSIENLSLSSVNSTYFVLIDLYLDEDLLNKIISIPINIYIIGSENSTGD